MLVWLVIACTNSGLSLAVDTEYGPSRGECEPGSGDELALYDEILDVLLRYYPYLEYKAVNLDTLGGECRQVVCPGDYNSFSEDAMQCLLSPLRDAHVGLTDRDGVYHAYGVSSPVPNADFSIVEALIDPESGIQSASVRTGTMSGGRFGYVRIETWVESALAGVDLAALVPGLGPVAGLVIDARWNWGGSPYLPQIFAGSFVTDTVTPYVFHLERKRWDRDPTTPEYSDPDPVTLTPFLVAEEVFAGPVALLIGDGCVSACESFVALVDALHPHARLFGGSTYGAGGSPELLTLADGVSEFRYTHRAVLRADGVTPIEWYGVSPNIPVEFSGDREDEVLSAALSWLSQQ